MSERETRMVENRAIEPEWSRMVAIGTDVAK